MRTPSQVWHFFDRLVDESESVWGVKCRLCEREFKFFGNTTNLRVHLKGKHKLQWSIVESGLPLDDPNVSEYVVIENGKEEVLSTKEEDSDDDEKTTTILRQKLHNDSGEDWNENDDYKPKPKKRRLDKIKISQGYHKEPQSSVYEPKLVHVESETDECSAFGKYVATKLRNLKSDNARNNVEQIISTIFWQANSGVFEDKETVKKFTELCLPPKPKSVDKREPIIIKVKSMQEVNNLRAGLSVATENVTDSQS